ncbi:MAG: response regulator, partial [Spirochaetia bacterium]|nr:response regulator [Spirochaetia bacterium]
MKTQILVIEDVPEMSQLICLYMSNAGYETTACEKAEEAIAKMQEGYIPDLVLLDLNLPGMSGFDFLKKFRSE